MWGPKPSPLRQSPTRISTRNSASYADLDLRHVIGISTASSNAIASRAESNIFAFTAGTAAVVGALNEDLTFSQRFYRARPTTLPLNPTPIIYNPTTPTKAGATSRAAANLRDASAQGSPLGTPKGEWIESPSSKTWSAKERVKAVTCVALSPDGKHVAVGETGYRPRVLIFSTALKASTNIPLNCMVDHSFGVRAVAFSPDSQLLASLGTVNDGFIYVWNINSRTGAASLHSSNKCTSLVHQISWVGSSLVTVGTRHVKIWRVDDSIGSMTSRSSCLSPIGSSSNNTSHKLLVGRNCLLGSLIDATFTAIASISASQAVVCTDNGHICLVTDVDGDQNLVELTQVSAGIQAATYDGNRYLYIGMFDGAVHRMDVQSLIAQKVPRPVFSLSSDALVAKEEFPIAAITLLGDRVAIINARRHIRVIRSPQNTDNPDQLQEMRMPAHGAPVLGVCALAAAHMEGAAFLTWSADGEILFWSAQGNCVHSIQLEMRQHHDLDDSNDLRAVRYVGRLDALIIGDTYGVLSVVERATGIEKYTVRAHAGEIIDLVVFEGESSILIASCSRDRTIQVFEHHDNVWTLVQTLDEHVGAVAGIRFSGSGDRLVSCSSDRTIVVRETIRTKLEGQRSSVAFSVIRTITLKAAPSAMAFHCSLAAILYVTTSDRIVHRFDIESGQSKKAFKASDFDGNDPVIISSLSHFRTNQGHFRLAGLSSTDKSIRIYDESGNLLGCDWGHSEGVTDLARIPSHSDHENCFASVGADGMIFLWAMNFGDASRSSDQPASSKFDNDSLATRPPLRRVLSQTEIARCRQSSPENEESISPSRAPQPTVRRSQSRFSLAKPPRLNPSPLTTSKTLDFDRRCSIAKRSPSPPSPKQAQRLPKTVERRASSDVRLSRTNSGPVPTITPLNESTLTTATEQICRSLRIYRRKLINRTDKDILDVQPLLELKKELGLTARAVAEKALQNNGHVEEQAMVTSLSQYSERLIDMLDAKFAASLASKPAKTVCTDHEDSVSSSIEDPRVKASQSKDPGGD